MQRARCTSLTWPRCACVNAALLGPGQGAQHRPCPPTRQLRGVGCAHVRACILLCMLARISAHVDLGQLARACDRAPALRVLACLLASVCVCLFACFARACMLACICVSVCLRALRVLACLLVSVCVCLFACFARACMLACICVSVCLRACLFLCVRI